VPYLSASEVIIHEQALYQMYATLPLLFVSNAAECFSVFIFTLQQHVVRTALYIFSATTRLGTHQQPPQLF